MTFHLHRRDDLAASASPYRVMDETGCEIEWANRFLDRQRVRGVMDLSLRCYGHTLLHFVRWWATQPGVDVRRFEANQFTESTLIDYVKAQREEPGKPSPEVINNRSSMLRRLFRFHFQQDMPHAPYLLQRNWWRSPLSKRKAPQAADLRLKVPPRVIEPLSTEQVSRFWESYRTARDIAIVGLMLFNGLRSREVLALELEDLLLSEGQIRVSGKGRKVRLMPVAPETSRVIDSYLRTERPLTNSARVFVCMKGKARGKQMTSAGLRSPFRYHRQTSGVTKANPHRFRHTFGSEMIRAGVSLPALMHLMGHANIQTTLLYIRISPQDVYAEYARAIAKKVLPARIADMVRG